MLRCAMYQTCKRTPRNTIGIQRFFLFSGCKNHHRSQKAVIFGWFFFSMWHKNRIAPEVAKRIGNRGLGFFFTSHTLDLSSRGFRSSETLKGWASLATKKSRLVPAIRIPKIMADFHGVPMNQTKQIWFHSRNTNPSRKALLSLFAAQIVNDSWTWGSSLIVGQWRDSYFMSWVMIRSLSILMIKLFIICLHMYVLNTLRTYKHIEIYMYMHIYICKRVGLQSLYHTNTPPNCCPGHRHRNPGCGAWGHASTLGGLGKVDFPAKKPWKMMKNAASHWFPLAYSALVTHEYLYNRGKRDGASHKKWSNQKMARIC